MRCWKNDKIDGTARVMLYLALRRKPYGGNELSLQGIADEVGVTYPHLNKILGRLRARGVVVRVDGVLTIVE